MMKTVSSRFLIRRPEYGLGLENAALGLIKNSEITDNGSWGIDLAPESTVGDILRTKIRNNANGSFRCGEDLGAARQAARAGSSDADRVEINTQ